MKKNVGVKIGVFLAVIVVFFTVHILWAQGPTCDLVISGMFTSIYGFNNAIVVEDETLGEVTVYGIPLNYLENWEVVDFDELIYVDISAHRCPREEKIMACEISFDGGDFLDLRPRQGRAGVAKAKSDGHKGSSM